MSFMKKVTGENRWIGILMIISAVIVVFLVVAVIIVSSGRSDWKESTGNLSSSSSGDEMLFVTNTGVADNNKKPDRDVIQTNNSFIVKWCMTVIPGTNVEVF